MNFKFACPNCGQRIGATLEDVGTTGGCPSCQQQFTVPAPANDGPKTETIPATVRASAATIAATPAPQQPIVETVTKRGLAVFALVLSIFPGFNLIALIMAICAVVRSDRPGRGGERGVAVAAVAAASLLVLPLNVMAPLGAYFWWVAAKRPGIIQPTSTRETPPASPRPSPTPTKQSPTPAKH
jgi:hypothetical protein